MNLRFSPAVAVSILLHVCTAVIVLSMAEREMQPHHSTPASEKPLYISLAEFSLPPSSAVTPEPPAAPRPKPPLKPEPGPSREKTKLKPDPEKTAPRSESSRPPEEKPSEVYQATGESGIFPQNSSPAAQNEAITASSGQQAPVIYNLDAVDSRPAVTRQALPEYPQKARRLNIQGQVEVKLVVDPSGMPRECCIHKADPAGYFEEEALAAARKTRFSPGKIKGRPIHTVVILPFVFKLR